MFSEESVRDIVEECLVRYPFGEAVLEAHYNLAFGELLFLYPGKTIEELNKDIEFKLLAAIARAESYVLLLRGVRLGNNLADMTQAEHLLVLLNIMRGLTKYLIEHYANLKSLDFVKKYSLEDLKKRNLQYSQEYEESMNTLRTTNQFAWITTPQDILELQRLLIASYQALLGKEKFRQFLESFNRNLSILREYKTEAEVYAGKLPSA